MPRAVTPRLDPDCGSIALSYWTTVQLALASHASNTRFAVLSAAARADGGRNYEKNRSCSAGLRLRGDIGTGAEPVAGGGARHCQRRLYLRLSARRQLPHSIFLLRRSPQS